MGCNILVWLKQKRVLGAGAGSEGVSAGVRRVEELSRRHNKPFNSIRQDGRRDKGPELSFNGALLPFLITSLRFSLRWPEAGAHEMNVSVTKNFTISSPLI